MLNAKQLKDRLLQAGLCTNENLSGCSPAEINEIEKRVGHKLPDAYKEILSVIGQSAGDFMSDIDMRFPSILTLTERTREWMSAYSTLPDNAFVFADRYGEQVFYFPLGQEADPPVFKWHNEEPGEFVKVFDSLWDFIEEELKGHEWQAGA